MTDSKPSVATESQRFEPGTLLFAVFPAAVASLLALAHYLSLLVRTTSLATLGRDLPGQSFEALRSSAAAINRHNHHRGAIGVTVSSVLLVASIALFPSAIRIMRTRRPTWLAIVAAIFMALISYVVILIFVAIVD